MAVQPHLLNLVADCKSAAEAWDCLRVLSEDNTTSCRAELEEELIMLRMQPSETIIKYVGRAKGLRNDLATAGVTKDDQTLALHIFRGLPVGYSTIRTVLRNSDAPVASALRRRQAVGGGEGAAEPDGRGRAAGGAGVPGRQGDREGLQGRTSGHPPLQEDGLLLLQEAGPQDRRVQQAAGRGQQGRRWPRRQGLLRGR
eukprot:TRINITY_DN13170_c0_g1_i1.p1 TRINITY_DN13170_c0_g1~~TRINITY_DN13170_c0_g1_i1.p1  ORF type:complete len:199 (+),score=28.55 TRINITY_DN13170_c0_g1_i1:467-1063(+)